MDDLYEAPEQEQSQPEDKGDGMENMRTELANKEAFPDAAPGKRYVVTIQKCHDKEVEFTAEPEGGDDEGAGQPEPEMAEHSEPSLME